MATKIASRTLCLRFFPALLVGLIGCTDRAHDCGTSGSGGSSLGGSSGSGGSGGTGEGGSSSLGGSGGSGGSSLAGSGGEGGGAVECTGDPREAGCEASEEYGYFVSPQGDDEGAGTAEAPLASVQEALRRAVPTEARRVIYVCADAGEYGLSETLEATGMRSAGVRVYGSLSCTGESGAWVYDEDLQARLVSSVPLAVRVEGFGSEERELELEGLSIESADASEPGGSSIAMLAVNSPGVHLEHVSLSAGRGADGEDAQGYGVNDTAPTGTPGNAGHNACSGDPLGGEAVETECGEVVSVGGKGGHGQNSADGEATAGETGEPLESEDMKNGGRGQTDETTLCEVGRVGRVGGGGPAGQAVSGPGSLGAVGYAAADGNAGETGEPGQGGGGGGGAFAPGSCAGMVTPTGASGGSGGGGGCGGQGGPGGGGGGASIALALLNSPLTLSNVTLTASSGGSGGHGAVGQFGGIGGAAGGNGTGDTNGCAGGDGGQGGKGGSGSGGAGGPSLGIGYVGEAPSETGVTAEVAETPAPGGFNGALEANEYQGGGGATEAELELGAG